MNQGKYLRGEIREAEKYRETDMSNTVYKKEKYNWIHSASISFIAKAMSDIKSKTSPVKVLPVLSVLFYFRTFCPIVHSHVKENHVWIFAYVFIVLLCISIIASIMAQV